MHHLRAALLASFALGAACVAAPANATLLNFVLTGSRNASFQLESNPAPDFYSSSIFGDQVQFDNIAGVFNGTGGTASTIGFGSGPIFADLNILGTTLGFTQFAGPNLFSGAAAAPVFTTGTFALTSIVSGDSTLTISDAVAGVPEPSTWAMMLVGFAGLGAALRSHRRPDIASA